MEWKNGEEGKVASAFGGIQAAIDRSDEELR
jgi:hypothetical protein